MEKQAPLLGELARKSFVIYYCVDEGLFTLLVN